MSEPDAIVRGSSVKFSNKELDATSLDEYIIAAVQKRSNDAILIDGVTEEVLEANEFLQKSYRLAAELQAFGCGRDTIVGVITENRLEYPIVLLGTLLTGAALTSYNPNYSSHEFGPLFNLTKPTVMFCSAKTRSTVVRVVPASTKVIIFDTPDNSLNIEPHLFKFSDLVQSTKGLNAVKNEPDKTAVILHSSGTTGLPKGVMLTHRTFVFLMKLQVQGLLIERTCSKILITTSMCHASGLTTLMTAITRDEIGIFFEPTWDYKLILSMIQKYKIKSSIALSGFVTFLLKDPAVDEYDLSSMESLYFGGAPVRPETQRALKEKFKNLKYVLQIYGMTESLYTTRPLLENQKVGTCGSPIPGIQIKVVDVKTGKILGKNETGELYVKGPNVMKGYFNNEKATAENMEDGWLRSGDIAYYDEDGDFFIVDRMKELIKCGGAQVSPAELESLLLTHPSVADVAVVGIPDDYKIELPRAFVVTKNGTEVTADEIIEYFNGMVQTPFKKLEGGVEFIPEIPRNSNGKILRKTLKEQWIDVSKEYRSI